MGDGGFRNHLDEAIRLNRERKPIYAAATGNRSKRLSNCMIWSERLSIPLALYFERKAARFNARGIPIVRDDFVSMTGAGAPEDEPLYGGRAAERDFRSLLTELREARREARDLARMRRWEDICRTLAGMLERLEERERALQAHFVMTGHILESAGFAAVNAGLYAELSGGETLPLSMGLVRLQLWAVTFAPMMDRMAQPLHALGCGIIVNDVPSIPFLPRLRECLGQDS